ncbi:hypothetical protein ACFL0Q_00960 [Thermodesulfobacteriota bacterium]
MERDYLFLGRGGGISREDRACAALIHGCCMAAVGNAVLKEEVKYGT